MNFRRAKTWRMRVGERGERFAMRALREKGFSILAHDCKTPRAELDVVCRDGATLVFVEVKTRFLRSKRDEMPSPREMLSETQKRRIYRGALFWMRALKRRSVRYRFDLVEVVLSASGPRMIRHTPGFLSAAPDGRLPGRAAPLSNRVFVRRKNPMERAS